MRHPTILEEAAQIVGGPRAKDYGSAYENMGRIARLWSETLGAPVTREQVVLCMIQVKVARLVNSPKHRDSWVDIPGYVAVADMMWAEEPAE